MYFIFPGAAYMSTDISFYPSLASHTHSLHEVKWVKHPFPSLLFQLSKSHTECLSGLHVSSLIGMTDWFNFRLFGKLTCLVTPGWDAWVPGCSAWPCWLLQGRGLPSLLRAPASAMSTPLSSLRVCPLSDSCDRVAPGDTQHCYKL